MGQIFSLECGYGQIHSISSLNDYFSSLYPWYPSRVNPVRWWGFENVAKMPPPGRKAPGQPGPGFLQFKQSLSHSAYFWPCGRPCTRRFPKKILGSGHFRPDDACGRDRAYLINYRIIAILCLFLSRPFLMAQHSMHYLCILDVSHVLLHFILYFTLMELRLFLRRFFAVHH